VDDGAGMSPVIIEKCNAQQLLQTQWRRQDLARGGTKLHQTFCRT